MVPIALPEARDLGRLLLSLLNVLGLLSLLLALAGLALHPRALLGAVRRPLSPPVQPASPQPSRPVLLRRRERQQLRSQITAARQRLARLRRQREHWALMVERMQAGGRRPHSRTLHNLERRSAEVVRAWRELRELEHRMGTQTR
jgi:hypothetical protein